MPDGQLEAKLAQKYEVVAEFLREQVQLRIHTNET